MAKNFVPLVGGGMQMPASAEAVAADIARLDSALGDLAEDVGVLENWDAGDIPYDSSETYDDGTVGAGLNDLKSAIDDVVIISNTEPSSADNKIWINDDATSVQVPTMDDHKALAAQAYAAFPSATLTNQDVISISDGADNIPVKSLVVNIAYNANGWKGLNLSVFRNNLVNSDTDIEAGAYSTTTGEKTAGSGTPFRCKNLIPVKPGITIKIASESYRTWMRLLYYGKDKTFLSYTSPSIGSTGYATATLPDNCYYIAFCTASSTLALAKSLQFLYPSTATDATGAHTVKTVNWETAAGTIYGGTFNATTGLLTSTLDSSGNALEETATYQLAPVEVCTQLGTTHIWADTGAITTTYREDVALYVQGLLS